MSVSAWVGEKRFEVGSAGFLKAWFSTIAVRLENEKWGSVFPTIMRDFYSGSLPSTRALDALKDLETIRRRLADLPPEQVVWDFEQRASIPPWGNELSAKIVSLGNYFVTSDGKDLFEVLRAAFFKSRRG